MKYRFERCFNSDLYMAKQVVGEAVKFLRRVLPTVSDELVIEMRLVLDELLMNAVIHGNQFDNTKTVDLCMEVDGGCVFSTIVDEGIGFDFHDIVKKFNRDDDVFRENGRGVKLAYHMTDMLYFNSNGREIKFSKRLVTDE